MKRRSASVRRCSSRPGKSRPAPRSSEGSRRSRTADASPMSTSPHANQPVAAAGAPLGESDAVTIMVHGRNAGPRNILDLVPRLQRPAWTYLAPTAADHTWYAHSFMAPIAQNAPCLSSALEPLKQLVADVTARGIRTDRIVLLGFSQGARLPAEI